MRIQADRVGALRVYLGAIAIGNLAWETLHLPLYTIWMTGTATEHAVAVVHCTGGDILIALTAVMTGLLAFGDRAWPDRSFMRVALVAMAVGVVYTASSEWLNVSVRQSWAYSGHMPTIPLGSVRIGLSPIAQWIVVPAAAFWTVKRTMGARVTGHE